MTEPRFGKVAIIGVGLLGGSLGLALKKRGQAEHILGIGRRERSVEAAQRMGLIDQKSLSLDDCSGTDLAVLCTPAASVPAQLETLAALDNPPKAITDVASTKAAICAAARGLFPAATPFVGCHPMAGSEKAGPEHADAALYEGRVCFIEPRGKHAPASYTAVEALWQSLGARLVPIEPLEHDRLLALSSHMPHVAAAAVARCVAEQRGCPEAFGAGFRDTTRVAEGPAEVWRDICLSNSAAVGDVLDALIAEMTLVRKLVAEQDGPLLARYFEGAREARRRVLGD